MELLRSSESIAKLTEALSKAQGIIEGASKDSNNPHFKSNYADLYSVWRACRAPLTEQGLAIFQTIDSQGDKHVLITTLSHTSGEFMRSFMPILPVRNDPQSFVGAVTYARRCSLAAMVGVCPSDDDGNEASAPADNPTASMTEGQAAELDLLLSEDHSKDWVINSLCERLKIATVYEMNSQQFIEAKKWLKNRKAKVMEKKS